MSSYQQNNNDDIDSVGSNDSNILNISKANIEGNCDLKCAYNFTYNNSNSNAQNNYDSIEISYERSSKPQVTYNGSNYYVSSINIYTPSLHNYDGLPTDAELIITHYPELGGDTLYVCIPLSSFGDNSTAASTVSTIINKVNNADANQAINLNINNFNLKNIVPSKPFFSYYGTEGLNGNVILFGKTNAALITPTDLNLLQQIISPSTMTLSGESLFYNQNGPNTSSINDMDGIYISCNPTDESSETVDVSKSKKSNNDINDSKLFKSGIIFMVFMIILIIIFVCLYYFFKYINSNKPIAFPTNLGMD